MRLSVVIPVHNEAVTLAALVARVQASPPVHQIIAVDDGSTDRSRAILDESAARDPRLLVLAHPRKRGKGAAIRTALPAVTGDLVLVQDADLEYDPAEYPALLAPFAEPNVAAVYGSRNLRANPRSTNAYYWGGRFLSWLANRLFGTRLTDEATGYKVVRTERLRALALREDGFGFCAELTGKLLRQGAPIREVPISYRPRSRAEGKKIRWHDGFAAVAILLRCRLQRRE